MPTNLNARFQQGGSWILPGGTPITPPDPGGGSTITLLQSNFDALTPGAPITLADFHTAMGDANVSGTSNLARTSIVAAAGRGNVIRQSFAASNGNGITALVDGPFAGRQVSDITFKYDVRFNGGLGKGCKLPGPAGNNSSASARDATGGKTPISTDAISGRLMLLTPGSGETSQPVDISNYMYHSGQHDNYGDDLLWGTGPAVGAWNTVEVRYKLNTVTAGTPNADGIVLSKWNGVAKVNRDPATGNGFIFRAKSDIYFTALFWDLFWGGADKAAWAPTVASSIDIDNLLITTPGP